GVAETGEVQIDSGEHRAYAVGVTLSRHALVLSSLGNGSWQGRWFARDGSPLSNAFTFSLQRQETPRLEFLTDGGLAMGFDQSFSDAPSFFVNRIDDGATAPGPLPPWLQQRSRNVLFAVRQGRAYATWGPDSTSCRRSDVEVLASASGKSCGCLTVSALSPATSMGRDGS